jgi:hypothetical protein
MEISLEWQGYKVLGSGLNSEPQNIQPQNFEGWNRFAQSFLK